MSKFKNIILVLGILMGFGMALIPVSVGAEETNVFTDCSLEEFKETAVCKGAENDFGKFLKLLVNNLLFVLGAIAVIVIIIAGITYSMSAGDPALVTKAKNTIIYALIGLVVAVSAYAVVNFVIGQF